MLHTDYRVFLNSRFNYIDGVLYSKRNGKAVGHKKANTYIHVKMKLDSDKIIRDYSHRIIYTMFNGIIPVGYDVHHIDGDRGNNKIENLEAVDRIKHAFLNKETPVVKEADGGWYIIITCNYNIYRFFDKDKSKLLDFYRGFYTAVISGSPLEDYEGYIFKKASRRNRLHVDRDYLLKKYYYQDGNLFKISTNKKIGHLHASGYYNATIKSNYKGLHKWIYMYHYGDVPEGMMVDHIDNDSLNNRIENLRHATPHLNSVNRKTKHAPRKVAGDYGWEVVVTRNGKNYRKYFNKNKYEEAVEFCLVLDEFREDADRIKELFTLTI